MNKLDNEISRLQEKLGIKDRSQKNIKESFEKDGLFELYNLEEDLDREYQEYRAQATNTENTDRDFDPETQDRENENDEIEIEEEKEDAEDLRLWSLGFDENSKDIVLLKKSVKSQSSHIFEKQVKTFRDSLTVDGQSQLISFLASSCVENTTEEVTPAILGKMAYLSAFNRISKFQFLNLIFHYLVQEFLAARNTPVRFTGFCRVLGYMYHFKIINPQFVFSFIENFLDDLENSENSEQTEAKGIQNRFSGVEILLRLTGTMLRKEAPKEIKNLSDRVKNFEMRPKELFKSIISKIRFNQTLEVKLCANLNKIKNLLKHHPEIRKIKSISLSNSFSFSSLLKYYDNDILIQRNLISKLKQSKSASFITAIKAKVKDLAPQIAKLGLETEKQQLIAACILSGENYKESAMNVYKLRVFQSKWPEIATTVLRMLCQELTFNNYYVYLTRELSTLIKGLDYSFLIIFWGFFSDLKETNSKTFLKAPFLIRLVVSLVKLKVLDLKCLKNLDWNSIYRPQQRFNLLFFKYLLKSLDYKTVQPAIVKLKMNYRDALFYDDLKDFATHYQLNFFKRHFSKLGKLEAKGKLKVLDCFKLQF